MVPKGTFAFVLTRIEFFHESPKNAFLINKIGINDINMIVIIKGYSGGKKNNTVSRIIRKIKKSIEPKIAEKIRGTTML